MNSLPNVVVVILILAVAIALRARRTIGRQIYSEGRIVYRLVILGILILLVLASISGNILSWVAAILGAAAGVAVGIWGLRLAHVERSEGRVYYRPNMYLGIALLVLFLARIAWRTFELAHLPISQTPQASQNAALSQYASDPASLLLLTVYVGYWAAFYIGLMLRARRLEAGTAQA